ncbi:MAG: hypothetical protein QM715_19745 [Nibricoccus sp.]
MIAVPNTVKAKFSYNSSAGAQSFDVNFNPSSLDYTITANSQGDGGHAQQTTGSASAKLNMELIFDTTDTGDDVRSKTNKVELMLQTSPGTGDNPPPQVLSEVTFEWGAFHFIGIVDSFKQTMDFFSPNGIPLRAVVTLSMAQNAYKFDQQGSGQTANVDQTLDVAGGSPSDLAAAAGDPTGARGIASANGLESLRAGVSGGISVGGGVSIGAAASFSAGASANAGLGAGLGFGASAGAGVGLSTGAGISAGVSASAGAFSELHTEATAVGGKYLDASRLLATASAPGVAPGALFDVTGKAIAQSSSTFKAEVGATSGLRFDDN